MIKENLKALCIKRGTTFSKLEKELGFSNGSLAKGDSISAERLMKIAQYFNVSMTSIIAPVDENGMKDEKEQLEYQNELLKHRAMILEKINEHYDEIIKLKEEVTKIDDFLFVSK